MGSAGGTNPKYLEKRIQQLTIIIYFYFVNLFQYFDTVDDDGGACFDNI